MFQSTPKQRAASRANAQKSTGPRTTAGKAVSRFNALKHGIYAVHQIMFDEKPEDLAELAAGYHEQYSPADAKQRFLVDTLVHNEWRLRRTRRVEAELWQSAYNLFIVKNIDTTSTCTSGDAFATDSSTEVARAHGLRTPQPRSRASRTRPATPTIQIHFQFLSFVPTESANPAPATPQPPPAPPFTQPDAPANHSETQPWPGACGLADVGRTEPQP
jgi:hypothetical protein